MIMYKNWKNMRRIGALVIFISAAICGILISKNHGFLPYFSVGERVSYLVSETTKSAERESKAFAELDAMDESAIPYIVGHLDDMRPLSEPVIRLENGPNTSVNEKFGTYGPVVVHDALSLILSRIARRNCYVGYEATSFEIRQRNRSQWISWCKGHYPSQSDICGEEMNGYESDPKKPLCEN
jgi:hypothetical protein